MKFVLSTVALATCMQLGCGSDSANAAFTPWQLEDLHGADGFSLRVPQYEVPAGHESQNCYFVRVPDLAAGQDFWIDHVLTAVNPGSHHMTVFQVKTITGLDPAKGAPIMIGDYQGTAIEGPDDDRSGPCWTNSNWADWPLVADSQLAQLNNVQFDWKLPDGVAIRFQPGEMLMVQTHYENTTDLPANYGARVGINFYRYQRSTPPTEMGALFARQTNIRICASQPSVSFSGTCRFPSDVTIAAANGHFHQRGQRFAISSWDGVSPDHPPAASQFYEMLDWNNPVMMTNLALSSPANSGFWYDCSFQWQPPTTFTCADLNAADPLQQNDCCYVFGGDTGIGEHCNVFLYYYPKVDSGIECDGVP